MFMRLQVSFGFLLTIMFASNVILEQLKPLERRDETGLLTANELLQLGRNMCAALQNLVDLVNNPIAAVFGLSDRALGVSLPIPRWVVNPLGIVSFIDSVKRQLVNAINSANIFNLNLGKRGEPLGSGNSSTSKAAPTVDPKGHASPKLRGKRTASSNQHSSSASQLFPRPLSKRQQEQLEGEEEKRGDKLTIGDLIELAKIPCEMVEFTQSIFNDTPLAWVGVGKWPLLLRDLNNDLNLMAVPRRFLEAVFGGR